MINHAPTSILARCHAQKVLFGARITRLQLLQLELDTFQPKIATINVWRNHAFEPLIPMLMTYATYCTWEFTFEIGNYDDSLSFSDWKLANLEVVWLDRSRFGRKDNNWISWFEQRLCSLRALSSAPIIVCAWFSSEAETRQLQDICNRVPALFFADIARTCSEAGIALLDPRTEKLAGTPLSGPAQLFLARELACHWIPATLGTSIKAVALDLDNTLHCGVLAEDGINGVLLTPAHQAFQRYIKQLQQSGIFIALVSKNNWSDVESLFSYRMDYPLRLEDFSAIEVSWDDKATSLRRIAERLRIGLDSVLFVDDNPGEIASVSSLLPVIHAVFAHPDAVLTKRVVEYYPGIWRWRVTSDDVKRIQDLRASAEREANGATSADPTEYFQSLKVRLIYRQNPKAQLVRLADLCNKTNQLNLALRRFNEVELADRMAQENACVVCVELSDRLSDSGIIAVIVAERQSGQMVVEELCISCRALGRRLESTIVILALRDMPIFSGCQEVLFRVQHGPRNEPALKWLASLLDEIDVPAPGSYSVPAERFLEFEAAEGVTLIRE